LEALERRLDVREGLDVLVYIAHEREAGYASRVGGRGVHCFDGAALFVTKLADKYVYTGVVAVQRGRVVEQWLLYTRDFEACGGTRLARIYFGSSELQLLTLLKDLFFPADIYEPQCVQRMLPLNVHLQCPHLVCHNRHFTPKCPIFMGTFLNNLKCKVRDILYI